MRQRIVRFGGVLLSVAAGLLLMTAPVAAVSGDTISDAALGQPDLTSDTCNNGGISARSLCIPSAVAMDASSGRLFVADAANNRVLSYPNTRRFQSGEAADLVLGQPDFTTGSCPGPNERSICGPAGLAVDPEGRLYVSDPVNGRVLRFAQPQANGQPADLVLGQPDFSTSAVFVGNPRGQDCRSQGSLCRPTSLTVDRDGRLYVGDAFTGVTRFDQPRDNGQAPDARIPSTDGPPIISCVTSPSSCDFFNVITCGRTVCTPAGLALTPRNQLYVADVFHDWILRFPTDQAADLVLGRPDFTVPTPPSPTICNIGGPSAQTLCVRGSVGFNAGLAVDATGRLYVADGGNNRVLRYEQPGTNGQVADFVLGQPNFVSTDCNRGGNVNASTLCSPQDVTVDFRGDLFVADGANNRVLRYNQPLNGTQSVGTQSVGGP